MSTRQAGLVGMWDCVAFDEVAGITLRISGVQIMKDIWHLDPLQGKGRKECYSILVFVGNINQSIDVL